MFPLPANCSAESIPHTPNVFAPISHDSSLAFSVPFEQVSDFLKAVQEIPDSTDHQNGVEQKKWIMKVARKSGSGSPRALRIWLTDAWSSFVDLIKVKNSDPASVSERPIC
jgi:hydroxymethylglutaryl-CoA reductase (NADPH)